MTASQDRGNIKGFLGSLRGAHPSDHTDSRSEVSVAEVLHCLADIEAEAALYYDKLAEYTDLPWVRDFALQLARSEEQHRNSFLDYARQLEGDTGAEDNRLKAPLSEELLRLLSERITLPPNRVERTAIYLGEKDAVEVAIRAEKKTVELLTQLRRYVPRNQHGHIDRVIKEEQQHQSFLENLHREHFGCEKAE